jgi:hypothetical protein
MGKEGKLEQAGARGQLFTPELKPFRGTVLDDRLGAKSDASDLWVERPLSAPQAVIRLPLGCTATMRRKQSFPRAQPDCRVRPKETFPRLGPIGC